MTRPFAFVDRDGTLIEDRGYAHRTEDCVLLPGAIEALARLRGAGYGIAILTNQSGIARGLFSAADYESFEAHLERKLAEAGVPIDGSYVCPHGPNASCACRKPGTGLIEQARAQHEIDLAQSFVIGDKAIDCELARRAGCRAVLVLTGQGEANRGSVAADVWVARDLREAAERIVAGV